MFICENCGCEHNGSYGSGRFCSDHCRRIYCGKQTKIHICNFKMTSEERSKDLLDKITFKCKYCHKTFTMTKSEKLCHIKWCDKNPNKNEYFKHLNNLHKENMGQSAWNKGLTSETNKIIKKRGELIHQKYLNGELIPYFLGKKHTKNTKEKLSIIRSKELENNTNYKHIKLFPLKNINGDEYKCQGTWEYNVAKKLNELGILWIRNNKINYIQEGIKRIYNPDFYLPNTDEYIEVKGFFFKTNIEKMNLVNQQHKDKNIIFIDAKYYKDFINGIVDIKDIPYYKDREFI